MSLLEDFDDDVAPANDASMDVYGRPNANAAPASPAAKRAPARPVVQQVAPARNPVLQPPQRKREKKIRPIFSVLGFPNPEGLPTSRRTRVGIGGTTIVVTTDSSVVRWSKTERGQNVIDEIELPAGRADIHKVFIDHTGHHVIVSMADGENYYVHNSARKLYFLRNLSNEVINAVLWDSVDGTPNFTKNILVGTLSGRIYETALERSTKNKSFKFIKRAELNSGIVTLQAEQRNIPKPGQARRLCVFVTTEKGTLQQYVGDDADFSAIFEKYAEKRPRDHSLKVRSKLPDCPIRFAGRKGAPPAKFSIVTDHYVMAGPVNFNQSEDKLFLIPNYKLDLSNFENPQAMVMTDYHYLIHDDNGITIMNHVSKEKAFFFPNKQFGGKVLQLLQHPGMGIILACTAERIFRIKKTDEVSERSRIMGAVVIVVAIVVVAGAVRGACSHADVAVAVVLRVETCGNCT